VGLWANRRPVRYRLRLGNDAVPGFENEYLEATSGGGFQPSGPAIDIAFVNGLSGGLLCAAEKGDAGRSIET
jgi:hypothetical protein